MDYSHVPPHLANLLIYLIEKGSHYSSQAGLKLLGSSSLPTLASHTAKITGAKYHAWLTDHLENRIDFQLPAPHVYIHLSAVSLEGGRTHDTHPSRASLLRVWRTCLLDTQDHGPTSPKPGTWPLGAMGESLQTVFQRLHSQMRKQA